MTTAKENGRSRDLISAQIEQSPGVSNEDDGFNAVPAASSMDFADMNYHDLNGEDPDSNLVNFLDPQTDFDKLAYHSSFSSSSLVRQTTPLTNLNHNLFTFASPSDLSIPSQPVYTFRSMIRRPEVKSGMQRIATLILHTLQSYPLMMQRQDSLPPFIHPSTALTGIDSGDMESLHNCMNLVYMAGGGVRGSRKLF